MKEEFEIDKKLSDALNRYSNLYEVTKNKTISEALRLYFTVKIEEEKFSRKSPDSKFRAKLTIEESETDIVDHPGTILIY